MWIFIKLLELIFTFSIADLNIAGFWRSSYFYEALMNPGFCVLDTLFLLVQ